MNFVKIKRLKRGKLRNRTLRTKNMRNDRVLNLWLLLYFISAIIYILLKDESKKRNQMDIIISGLGAVGTTLMQELTDEGHNIVVVDINGDKVEKPSIILT